MPPQYKDKFEAAPEKIINEVTRWSDVVQRMQRFPHDESRSRAAKAKKINNAASRKNRFEKEKRSRLFRMNTCLQNSFQDYILL